ncbi:SDR family NAD(P)-dependent oxidoreductase [Spiribacter pallidus]|uniref:SDR family NAD(P)-dependent oxidoreductase n=1 Tax=Spiribacter pallidus TaxID=1987936 RepID=UPI00349FFEA6
MTPDWPITPSTLPQPGRLTGQRLLITGAAGGLGSAVAATAAAEGADLVLLDRDIKGLEALHDDIEAKGHPRPALYPLDYLSAAPDDYAELATGIAADLGGIEQLLHTAADAGDATPMALYDPQTWLKTLHININGAFLVTQALLPMLREQAGRVIFVDDHDAHHRRAATGAYGVSKAALMGMMRVIAAEHSPANPVVSCAIDPGSMRTALRRGLFAGEMAEEVDSPAHAAGCVAALLDPRHPPANGVHYRVDA